ncbi:MULTISPECIES: hypothetical protein [unclassified Methylophaga]|jgi:hypothetical protein|uniref:hypothetical protein n=1 Tax=unclassified Methylophaga TaxID=2629249 RepID=UPI00259CE3B6|nr:MULTISPECIES: hypothetical protein [unclassified Methylophaga]|tara:strand:+ start:12095 stop:12544 length:450 start_codon:yes stop_codon:yes gene_type:complete
MKWLPSLLVSILSSFLITQQAQADTALRLNNPCEVAIGYLLEPEAVNEAELRSVVSAAFQSLPVTLAERDDARLIVRVEEHAGRFLLYADFHRHVFFPVDDSIQSTWGYVWGRYAKNIINVRDINDDLAFFMQEFLHHYQRANNLDHCS